MFPNGGVFLGECPWWVSVPRWQRLSLLGGWISQWVGVCCLWMYLVGVSCACVPGGFKGVELHSVGGVLRGMVEVL